MYSIFLGIALTDFIPDSGSLKFRIEQNRSLESTAWFRRKTVLRTGKPFFKKQLCIQQLRKPFPGKLISQKLKRWQPIGADSNFNKNKLNYFPKLGDHYVYLLMDSRGFSHTKCSLENFLSGIFYVGMGKNDRAIQHMHEARRALLSDDIVTNDKIDRIHKIWSVDQDAEILMVRNQKFSFLKEQGQIRYHVSDTKIRHVNNFNSTILFN